MKLLILAACLVSSVLCYGQQTTENKPTEENVERAWLNEIEAYNQRMGSAPYCFGSLFIHKHVFGSIFADPKDDADSDENNPSSDDEDDQPKGINPHKLPPLIPFANNPQCLPKSRYYNMAPLLKKLGVTLKGNEWALGQLQGDAILLYFCTSRSNADVLEQIIHAGCVREPFVFDHSFTLVSIEDNSLTDEPWTMDRLVKSKPTVHARAGMAGSSGMMHRCSLSSKKPSNKMEVEVLPNMGADAESYALDLNFKWKSPSQNTLIRQRTQLDGKLGLPTIIDLGRHGKMSRRFLLSIHTTGKWLKTHDHSETLEPVQKIEGIYAMRNTPAAKVKTRDSYRVTRIQTLSGFLPKLRNVGFRFSADDPFGGDISDPLPGPPRVLKYPKNLKAPADHLIYNITDHAKHTGLSIRKEEWVYFNKNTQRLILFGSPSMEARARYWAESNFKTDVAARASFRIIEVDINSLSPAQWTIDKIKASNPKIILDHSSQARSGESAKAGKVTAHSNTDKDGKKSYRLKSEYQFTPQIPNNQHFVDLDYLIQNKRPLGTEQLRVENTSYITVHDGKPKIIPLGHHMSGNRIYLLVITANIIMPDGRFLRNRFQPIP
ncbi:MAG: hypothetical protein ACPG32_04760 [Akkermansiaceae bacterium]